MTVTVRAVGIAEYKRYLEAAPANATTSARIALNTVARRVLKTDAPEAMRKQVAFPAGYLEDPSRLDIDRPATNSELETSIVGRDRPTSLARFAEGLAAFGTKQTTAVKVTVKPGHPHELKRVFAVRLNVGDGSTDAFNTGLAVRLKPGEVLQRRNLGNDVPEIFPNVFLLYGPSVGQVFEGVADDLADPVGDMIETEFLRQFLLDDSER